MSFILKFDAANSDDDTSTVVANISSVLTDVPEDTKNLSLLIAGESVIVVADTEDHMKEQLNNCLDEGTTVYVNGTFFVGAPIQASTDEDGIEDEVTFISLYFNIATKKETLAALGA